MHYDWGHPVKLSVDTSPYRLGVVIMLVYANVMHCLCIRMPREHEKRYGQFDKEALAILFGLKQVHSYLYGWHNNYLSILTDHKPLEHIFGPKTTILSLVAMCLQWWAIILIAFNYSIKFVLSKQNTVAGALSCLPSPLMAGSKSTVFKLKSVW